MLTGFEHLERASTHLALPYAAQIRSQLNELTASQVLVRGGVLGDEAHLAACLGIGRRSSEDTRRPRSRLDQIHDNLDGGGFPAPLGPRSP